ncbi:MAG: hypothetical protein WCF20_00535 [Methylovirgula sp.]
MDKRIRSPNYPALSLPEAVEKITTLYRNLHNHSAPREVIAKALGYAGLNGASATVISALNKYGLLERIGDDHKISDRAKRILNPLSEEEKTQAIREAAFDPPLFAELSEKFPGRIPNEDLLKNYLSRKGFAPGALSSVTQAYRQTSEMVSGLGAAYDSVTSPQEDAPMPEPTHHQASPIRAPMNAPMSAQQTDLSSKERSIGRYDFEGGAYVKILASSELDTEAALDMVETLITLKRKELERKSKQTNATTLSSNSKEEDSEVE